MKLLGGGRCTKGGCMCYAGFFDHDGSPMSRIYPEDDFWFDLTSKEQRDIRTAMALFRFVFFLKKMIRQYGFEMF